MTNMSTSEASRMSLCSLGPSDSPDMGGHPGGIRGASYHRRKPTNVLATRNGDRHHLGPHRRAARARRLTGCAPVTVADTRAPVIGREALIRNKIASARPKDLADLAILGATRMRAKRRRK